MDTKKEKLEDFKTAISSTVRSLSNSQKIEVSFGINEDNSAKALQADLDDRGLDTTARTWIEPPTLKKLIRERVESNQNINLELFNAFVGQVAKIKGEK